MRISLNVVIFLFSLIFTLNAFPQKLEYISRFQIPSAMKFESTVIGGLSAIAQDGKKYFVVSDDRGKISNPRYYEFQINENKKSNKLEIEFLKVFEVQLQIDQSVKLPKTADFEGIQFHKDRFFILSDEGHFSAKPRRGPSLQIYNENGQHIKNIIVPSEYLPDEIGEQKKGTQDNAGFEGLSLSPSNQLLYAATERNLVQDSIGPRIAVFHYSKDKNFQFIKDCFYPFRTNDYQTGEIFKGISEIITIDETRLLVLERGLGFVQLRPTYFVQIYLVNMNECQKGREVLTKKNILNLNDLKMNDSEEQILQNYEGLGWLNSNITGQKTLIVVSDDNFKKREKTEFLFFKFSE